MGCHSSADVDSRLSQPNGGGLVCSNCSSYQDRFCDLRATMVCHGINATMVCHGISATMVCRGIRATMDCRGISATLDHGVSRNQRDHGVSQNCEPRHEAVAAEQRPRRLFFCLRKLKIEWRQRPTSQSGQSRRMASLAARANRAKVIASG